MRSVRMTLSALLLVAVVTACAPMATHPPINGTVLINPGVEPIPTLMVRSLQFASLEYGDGTPVYVYNLPERTTRDAYEMVADRLDGGRPMLEPGEPAFHVTSVRARGAKAEVDLMYPDPEGTLTLVTIHLQNELMRGWRVTETRRWDIPGDVPAPTYPGAATEQVAALPAE